MKCLKVLTLVLMGVTTAGCYSGRLGQSTGGQSTGDASVMSLDEAKQEMVTRWNQTVNDNPSDFASSGFSFIWPSFDRFPHPTFRGGSQEAYQEFARLLLIYTQTGDNFDFLASNQLFDVQLYDSSVAPGAQFGTLRKLVDDFASDSYASQFAFSAETSNGLKQLKEKIAALG